MLVGKPAKCRGVIGFSFSLVLVYELQGRIANAGEKQVIVQEKYEYDMLAFRKVMQAANIEVMAVAPQKRNMDCTSGLVGND